MALKRSNLKLDSPVNNFATLNPSHHQISDHNTFHDGNLYLETHAHSHSNSNLGNVVSTMAGTRGKSWYWEVYITSNMNYTHTNGTYYHERVACALGVINDHDRVLGNISADESFQKGNRYLWGVDAHRDNVSSGWNMYWHEEDGTPVLHEETAPVLFYSGDILSFHMDLEAYKLYFYVNGTRVDKGSGEGYDGSYNLSQDYENYWPIMGCGSSGGKNHFRVNFGQNPDFSGQKSGGGRHSDANGRGEFYYKPPWGALALCSANLPAAMNEAPSQNFKPVIYDGEGVEKNVDFGFSPDFVWIKARENGNVGHYLFDTVRGLEQNNWLISNEDTQQNSSEPSQFDITPTGIKLKTSYRATNNDTEKYIAWSWKAGGAPKGENNVMIDGVGSTMVDSGLDTGDITPTAMSINTQAGFSIISYTSQGSSPCIPHGLGKRPDMVIVKQLDGENPFMVWHSSFSDPKSDFIRLNTNEEKDTSSNYWGGETDDSLIYLGNGNTQALAKTNNLYICYAWHSVPGYSAFGSYEGNGSTDGPFNYTGFKPAWLMIKCVDNGYNNSSWVIYDNARTSNNPCVHPLHADSSASEGYRNDNYSISAENTAIDFLSNGFKIRNGYTETNHSNGGKYMYACFAEKPPTVPEKVKYEVSSEPRHSFLFDGENYLKGKWGHLGYQFSYHNYYNDQSYTMSPKFTISFWIKITEQSGGYISLIRWGDSTSSTVDYTFLGFNDQPKNNIIMNSKVGSVVIDVESTAHTPINSWNHIMWTGEGKTNADSKFFLNGKETDLSYNIGASSSGMQRIDNAGQFYMGLGPGGAYGNQFLLSDFYLVESMRCTPEDFCKYENGKLVPKTFDNIPQNTYGMHLDFHPSNMEYDSSGNLTLVKDSSGNGNHLTVND